MGLGLCHLTHREPRLVLGLREHAELVSAQPGTDRTSRRRGRDQSSCLGDQGVPCLVSPGVVDRLQPVEVEEQGRRRLASACAPATIAEPSSMKARLLYRPVRGSRQASSRWASKALASSTSHWHRFGRSWPPPHPPPHPPARTRVSPPPQTRRRWLRVPPRTAVGRCRRPPRAGPATARCAGVGSSLPRRTPR